MLTEVTSCVGMLCVCACAQEGSGCPGSAARGAARSLQLPGVRHGEKAGSWQTGTSGPVTKGQPSRVSGVSTPEGPHRVLSNNSSNENQGTPTFQIKTPGRARGGLNWETGMDVHSLCLAPQPCPTLCDPMDRSPPDSSVHEDSPGKTTGVGSISFSRASSRLRDRTHVSFVSCTDRQVLHRRAKGEAPKCS